jgi:hypothetical protein
LRWPLAISFRGGLGTHATASPGRSLTCSREGLLLVGEFLSRPFPSIGPRGGSSFEKRLQSPLVQGWFRGDDDLRAGGTPQESVEGASLLGSVWLSRGARSISTGLAGTKLCSTRCASRNPAAGFFACWKLDLTRLGVQRACGRRQYFGGDVAAALAATGQRVRRLLLRVVTDLAARLLDACGRRGQKSRGGIFRVLEARSDALWRSTGVRPSPIFRRRRRCRFGGDGRVRPRPTVASRYRSCGQALRRACGWRGQKSRGGIFPRWKLDLTRLGVQRACGRRQRFGGDVAVALAATRPGRETFGVSSLSWRGERSGCADVVSFWIAWHRLHVEATSKIEGCVG